MAVIAQPPPTQTHADVTRDVVGDPVAGDARATT